MKEELDFTETSSFRRRASSRGNSHSNLGKDWVLGVGILPKPAVSPLNCPLTDRSLNSGFRVLFFCEVFLLVPLFLSGSSHSDT